MGTGKHAIFSAAGRILFYYYYYYGDENKQE
jgi:hypothetical protein